MTKNVMKRNLIQNILKKKPRVKRSQKKKKPRVMRSQQMKKLRVKKSQQKKRSQQKSYDYHLKMSKKMIR